MRQRLVSVFRNGVCLPGQIGSSFLDSASDILFVHGLLDEPVPFFIWVGFDLAGESPPLVRFPSGLLMVFRFLAGLSVDSSAWLRRLAGVVTGTNARDQQIVLRNFENIYTLPGFNWAFNMLFLVLTRTPSSFRQGQTEQTKFDLSTTPPRTRAIRERTQTVLCRSIA